MPLCVPINEGNASTVDPRPWQKMEALGWIPPGMGHQPETKSTKVPRNWGLDVFGFREKNKKQQQQQEQRVQICQKRAAPTTREELHPPTVFQGVPAATE